MKKGDLRRDSILKTAERLFFERGYEETSIQDILDALSISKGGFYHYFESKLSLLEEICHQNARQAVDRVRLEISMGRLSPVQKLNILLSQVQLFNQDQPQLNALILKICYVDGDVNFREHMRVFMIGQLQAMLTEVIREGMADGSFFTRSPAHAGRMILMLACNINDDTCRILAEEPENPDCLIHIADMLNAYRDAIEMLIGAVCGSVQIYDMEHLLISFRQTAKELNMIKRN